MGSRTVGKISILEYFRVSWKYYLSIALIIFCIFNLFRFLDALDRHEKERAIEGLLRSEYLNADSYALSKALTDLETLGFIRCVRLTENFKNPRVYYDTTHGERCLTHRLGEVLKVTSSFQAINGLQYTLSYQRPVEWQLLSLEALSYFIGIALITFYFSRLKVLERENLLKIQALKIEKELLEGHARQIRHDVASPLSAFRVIVKSANGLDDTIKSILVRAIERTEEIFNTLNERTKSNPAQIAGVEINKVISDLVHEKQAMWLPRVKITFHEGEQIIGLCNRLTFQRVLSNILNNSFEAIPVERTGNVTIRTWSENEFLFVQVRDDGKGIPDKIKPYIGREGFSFGKDSEINSGSGIGIHNAKHELNAWGGELIIESTFGHGTVVTMKFRAA